MIVRAHQITTQPEARHLPDARPSTLNDTVVEKIQIDDIFGHNFGEIVGRRSQRSTTTLRESRTRESATYS